MFKGIEYMEKDLIMLDCYILSTVCLRCRESPWFFLQHTELPTFSWSIISSSNQRYQPFYSHLFSFQNAAFPSFCNMRLLYLTSWAVSLLMIARIFVLQLNIIIKLETGVISHCLGLGHETFLVYAVCFTLFPWRYKLDQIYPLNIRQSAWGELLCSTDFHPS